MNEKKVPKWIRVILFIISILTAIIYLLIYIGKEDRPVYNYDASHNIYYSKDQFDERFLKSVGDSLKSIGYFIPDAPSDIMLTRNEALGDTVSVAFIIEPSKLNEEAKKAFYTITSQLKPLMKTHIKLEFKDNKFNTVDQVYID